MASTPALNHPDRDRIHRRNFFSRMLYRRTTIPLAIILVSSAAISVIAYYYSLTVADTIDGVASNDVRLNAATQARDLSLILSNGVDVITTNLQILSNSPSIQSYNDEARILFDVAQNSTGQLTQFYMWLGDTGKVEWVTNTSVAADNYVGLDRSSRIYFTAPRLSLAPYLSDITLSPDKIPRLYVSYPILDRTNKQVSGPPTENDFRGVVLAAISLENIGNLLRQSSPIELQRNDVLLLDNSGTVVYSRDSWLTGRNVVQDRQEILQSGLADSVALDKFTEALEHTAQGKSFTTDFTAGDGSLSSLASEPVMVDGRRIWTVQVIAPHTLAADVRVLFDQQNIFSAVMVVIFGALAFGVAFFVVSSNRRLSIIVDERTEDLKRANESLEETNMRLAMLNGQLLSANEKLLVNDKLQKEFINIASHEMKTPTQAILLHSDIVKRKPGHAEKSIEAIVRNAERLQRLTTNVLDVTRIESQTLKLTKEELNLGDLISSVIADFRAETRRSIEFVFDRKDIVVVGDSTRLTQVLSNLLANAVEFTQEGKVIVTTQIEAGGKEVSIRVTDDGPGLDAEIVPRLFAKFATKSNRGTGLGLFIAKSIVEAHGGRIWAENNSNGTGRGATFIFTLPITTSSQVS